MSARAPMFMTFIGSIHRALAMAAAAALVATTAPLDAQQTRERREQHVYVAVSADEDAPVTDLKPAEFTVREDDLAREVLRIAGAADAYRAAGRRQAGAAGLWPICGPPSPAS